MLDYDGWGDDDDSDESLPELICRPTNMYVTDSSSSEEEDEEDGPIPQWILDVRKYNEIEEEEEEDAIVELEVHKMELLEEVVEPNGEEYESEKLLYNVHDCASRAHMDPQIKQNVKVEQSTIGAQSYLDSNVESDTDSTKAIQKAESDNDNGVESVELPTRSEVESRPNVDAILSSLNHVNPTNPITKSTILGHTSNFSTQVAPEVPISDQGYSNTVPEWLMIYSKLTQQTSTMMLTTNRTPLEPSFRILNM